MEGHYFILVLCLCVFPAAGDASDVDVPALIEACPMMNQCNSQFLSTLLHLRDDIVDCGGIEAYLICCFDHFQECSTSAINKTNVPPPLQPVAVKWTGQLFYKMSELDKQVCVQNGSTEVKVAANESALFSTFFETNETYVKFDYFIYMAQNLSRNSDCKTLANCSRDLARDAGFSTKYFPCSSMIKFEDCFKTNEPDCPVVVDFPEFTNSVNDIATVCGVSSGCTLQTSLLLVVTALWASVQT